MIKLLVVDDSPLIRQLLTEVFRASGEFEVGVARSGAEALEQIHLFAPDVITLDIHMPGMNGLDCLDRIMVERPCPVVMVSALTAEGATETLEALALGAVDFIAKPRGAVSLEIDALAPELVARVRDAASARVSLATRLRERVRLRSGRARRKPPARRKLPAPVASPRPFTAGDSGLVLVGCSTGGPPALDRLLGALPEDFPWPILVAQHMPAAFTGPLARRLDRLTALSVCEIDQTMPLQPGHAYIARGDADVIVSQRPEGIVALPSPRSAAYFWHPSVDHMVDSAARVLPPDRLVGVLLTGMGNDGARAMAALREQGGRTIAESAETAVVWGMPGVLADMDGADLVLPLGQIAPTLVDWLSQ